jgi:uncharacterized protein
MQKKLKNKHDFEKAADIVRDAGGKVVGRTRLQKIAYLLEATGLGEGFTFEYRHYGPYSEQLARSVSSAELQGLIQEEEQPASWGGSYSIFTSTGTRKNAVKAARTAILDLGVKANPVALELAATAAFLALEGNSDPWDETTRRKPEKASERLNEAKDLYKQLQSINVPQKLPSIA